MTGFDQKMTATGNAVRFLQFKRQLSATARSWIAREKRPIELFPAAVPNSARRNDATAPMLIPGTRIGEQSRQWDRRLQVAVSNAADRGRDPRSPRIGGSHIRQILSSGRAVSRRDASGVMPLEIMPPGNPFGATAKGTGR